jgi:hypothetical protein
MDGVMKRDKYGRLVLSPESSTAYIAQFEKLLPDAHIAEQYKKLSNPVCVIVPMPKGTLIFQAGIKAQCKNSFMVEFTPPWPMANEISEAVYIKPRSAPEPTEPDPSPSPYPTA